jgi:hypothetical protein
LHNYKPFGIDRVKELLRAASECRLPETLSLHLRQAGYIFEHVIFGTSGFATIEPDNIAAMLALDKGFKILSRIEFSMRLLTYSQGSG